MNVAQVVFLMLMIATILSSMAVLLKACGFPIRYRIE